MTTGPEQQREPIGALLARLIEDARALAKAELAMFRTDFYRRMARARIGALLCLVGAIMGQAAAVTLLVTLSFVLTPWIGRLGASFVSVALGFGLAVALIKAGVARLVMVVEDFEEEDRQGAGKPSSALDKLFDRMRERSQKARNDLAETVDETQARLHPQALLADLADEVVNQAQAMSHSALDAVKRRPAKVALALTGFVLLLFRRPIFRTILRLSGATPRDGASLKKTTGRPATSLDEETSS